MAAGADNKPNGNGYARFNTIAVTIAACLGVVVSISGAIWFAISIAVAPISQRIDALDTRQTRTEDQLVPRKEHDRFDSQLQQQLAALQRQMDQNRDDIHAIYTPSDALKRMQDRLDALEAELHSRQK